MIEIKALTQFVSGYTATHTQAHLYGSTQRQVMQAHTNTHTHPFLPPLGLMILWHTLHYDGGFNQVPHSAKGLQGTSCRRFTQTNPFQRHAWASGESAVQHVPLVGTTLEFETQLQYNRGGVCMQV